jgi:hypothetical protein
MSDPVPPDHSPAPGSTAGTTTQPAERSRHGLSVDWAAVLVAGVLVLAVASGLLPGIPW